MAGSPSVADQWADIERLLAGLDNDVVERIHAAVVKAWVGQTERPPCPVSNGEAPLAPSAAVKRLQECRDEFDKLAKVFDAATFRGSDAAGRFRSSARAAVDAELNVVRLSQQRVRALRPAPRRADKVSGWRHWAPLWARFTLESDGIDSVRTRKREDRTRVSLIVSAKAGRTGLTEPIAARSPDKSMSVFDHAGGSPDVRTAVEQAKAQQRDKSPARRAVEKVTRAHAEAGASEAIKFAVVAAGGGAILGFAVPTLGVLTLLAAPRGVRWVKRRIDDAPAPSERWAHLPDDLDDDAHLLFPTLGLDLGDVDSALRDVAARYREGQAALDDWLAGGGPGARVQYAGASTALTTLMQTAEQWCQIRTAPPTAFSLLLFEGGAAQLAGELTATAS